MNSETQSETEEVVAIIKSEAIRRRLAELKQRLDYENRYDPDKDIPVDDIFDKDGNLDVYPMYASCDEALGRRYGLTAEEVALFRKENDLEDQAERQYHFSLALYKRLEVIAGAYQEEKALADSLKVKVEHFERLYKESLADIPTPWKVVAKDTTPCDGCIESKATMVAAIIVVVIQAIVIACLIWR